MRTKTFLIGTAIFSATFMSFNSNVEYTFLIGIALMIFSLMPPKK